MRRKNKIKFYHLVLVAGLIIGTVTPSVPPVTSAKSCPEVRIVFARGSGGERWTDQNYLAFKDAIENKLKTTKLTYDFVDLDYPAVGVGLDNLEVTAGAYIGGGESYKFGDSVKTGSKNLLTLVNDTSCKNTKYVLGGYSQGAMVISRTLPKINADKIIYAATFGDPKIYLPEGAGIFPAACKNKDISDYRVHVPDCRAYKGLLGAYIPYRPESFAGKVGTWCNRYDVFCSAHLSMSDHTSYVAENLYEDASRVIFNKITSTFGIKNTVSSPHDTAILIDSTASMAGMLEIYKAGALKLAKQTLEAGGRVALYDYRDLDDPYDVVEHCNFETCTLEKFTLELENIQADGGGDLHESLLSASFKTMKALEWKRGSTKSLVIITDAGFLMPDRDGITVDQVIKLSKSIDPVNFYIVTAEMWRSEYQELVEATDGKIITEPSDMDSLTEYILSRYDSLPRVEDADIIGAPTKLPVTEITRADFLDETTVKISFNTTGEANIVFVNDLMVGIVEGENVVIKDLKTDMENLVRLVPIGEGVRGDGVEVGVYREGSGGSDVEDMIDNGSINSSDGDVFEIDIPKAPNAGRL